MYNFVVDCIDSSSVNYPQVLTLNPFLALKVMSNTKSQSHEKDRKAQHQSTVLPARCCYPTEQHEADQSKNKQAEPETVEN